VHAGDVFDRPSVPAPVAYRAFEPLCRIADGGTPVFVVPGNHERSRIPHERLAAHPRVHVFDRPRTFVADVRGTRIALAGFPYVRRNVRTRFAEMLDDTEWTSHETDRRVLCIHHCVEGATVGPADFTFTTAADVIRTRDIPSGFSAVLSGHIHRHQVLTRALSGESLTAPVLYPGSIERTSTAEIDEPKGFMVVHVGERDVRWEFRRLYARPMVHRTLDVDQMTAPALESSIRAIVADVPTDAVLSVRVTGELTDAHWQIISAAHVRTIAPGTMNLEITPDRGFAPKRLAATRPVAVEPPPQLSFSDAAGW